MLGILLGILKIIGIIFLVILALLAVLLAVVLLAPVTYRVQGRFRKEEKNLEVSIRWLYPLIQIPISVTEDGCKTGFKLLGINFNQKSKSNKKKKREPVIQKEPEPFTQKEPEPVKQEESEPQEKPVHNDTAVPKHFRIIDKIRGKIEKGKQFLKKIQDLLKKKEELLQLWEDPEIQDAIHQSLVLIKKVFHHILPRKLRANLRFGLEYPDQTGKLYAFLSAFYGMYGKSLILEPDFENKILEGDFWCKGRIRLLNLIYYGISFYRIKKIREIISKYR